MPEDCFERMENRVFEAVKRKRSPFFGGFFRTAAFRWAAMTAAAAALVLALRFTVYSNPGYDELLAAFETLSDEDQEYLLEINEIDLI